MQWDFQVCENKLYLLGEALRGESCQAQLAPFASTAAVTWEGT